MSFQNYAPVAPVGLSDSAAGLPAALPLPKSHVSNFAELMIGGVEQVDSKLKAADTLVRAFSLDDSIPVHQVTYALEQARLSTELMMQVRSRLLEGYQQLMNMQL